MKRFLLTLPAPLRAVGVRLVDLALRLSARRAGIVLVYHGLAESAPDLDRDVVPAHEVSLFEEQLRHALRRYRVVPAHAILEAVRSRRRGERFPLAVTFDDDLSSHVTSAMPVLERLGVPATFFLCGASLERPHAFWWERLQRAVELGVDLTTVSETPMSARSLALRLEEADPRARAEAGNALQRLVGDDPPHSGLRADGVRALAVAGFEIGFHTLRHDRLPPLGDEDLAAALTDGRSALEEACGCRLTAIAYPHGRADERVARAARAAGFELGFTGAGEPVQAGSDPMLLARIEPAFTDVRAFAGQLVWALGAGHR